MTDIHQTIETMSPVQRATLRGLQDSGGGPTHHMNGAVRKALEGHGLIDQDKYLTDLGHEVIDHLKETS